MATTLSLSDAAWAAHQRGISYGEFVQMECKMTQAELNEIKIEHKLEKSEQSENHKRAKLIMQLKLYDSGMTDAQIARQIGVSASAVCRWRQKYKIASQKSKRRGKQLCQSVKLQPLI